MKPPKLFVRYDGEFFQGGDGNPVYIVMVSTYQGAQAVYCSVVWVTQYDKPRCVGCQGAIVAMSASCRHAQAVKRALASGNLILP